MNVLNSLGSSSNHPHQGSNTRPLKVPTNNNTSLVEQQQLKSSAHRNAASAKVPGEVAAGSSKEHWEAGNAGRTFSGNKGAARDAAYH